MDELKGRVKEVILVSGYTMFVLLDGTFQVMPSAKISTANYEEVYSYYISMCNEYIKHDLIEENTLNYKQFYQWLNREEKYNETFPRKLYYTYKTFLDFCNYVFVKG